MIPKILGVYESVKSDNLGTGTTRKQQEARIYWFAAQVPGGEIACQPLNDAYFPSAFVQKVGREEFLKEYRLAPDIYENHLAGVVASLREALLGMETAEGLPEFSHEQSVLLKGLVAFLHVRPGGPLNDKDVFAVRAMLDAMRQARDVVLEYQRMITGAAIDLRKERRFDLAVEYYERALELDAQNDHIMFNLARVYFEMGRVNDARDMLFRALESNPELEVARRFLRYLDASGSK